MDKLKQAWEVAKLAALAIAVVTGAYYCHLYQQEKALREQKEIAEKGLPPGVLAQYVLENRKLIEMVKNSKGKTEVRTTYVPDEGKVTVITKERDEWIARYNDLVEKLRVAKSTADVQVIVASMTAIAVEINKPPEVKVKDWGFTSRFGFGIVASPGNNLKIDLGDNARFNLPISPALDWKFFYAKRWSAIAQVNMFYFGPGVTRHVDDFTPSWLHANNLELGLTGGKTWTGSGWAGGVTLRSNF